MNRRGSSMIRVRYAETDQMAVAWHGEYLAWFEVARTDLLRATGLTYRELEGRDVRLPVIAAEVRYFRPAHYDDELEIRTELVELGGASVRFAYEVHREGTAGTLATGSTTHASVDREGRVRRLPADVRRLLA